MKIYPIVSNVSSVNYSNNSGKSSQTNPCCRNISFEALTKSYPKIMHIVMDGVGIKDSVSTNPLLGNMPFLTGMKHNAYGMTLFRPLEAAGRFVGLDDGEPGNSEVGHGVMGAGRNIKQAMVRLDEALEDGSFFENKEFLNAMNYAKKNNSTLHILSSIGYSHTHSKLEHVEALIKMARENGVKDLAVHAFLNGDGPTSSSSIQYLNKLNLILKENSYPQVASIIGRSIALDKSGDSSKIEQGYKMLVDGSNSLAVEDISEGLKKQLENNAGVELPPTIVKGSPRISDNDAVIFANYRTDRPKGLTASLAYKDTNYDFVKQGHRPQNLYFVTMTEYDPKFGLPTALDTMKYDGTLKEELLDNGWHITSCAQKEKHSHVTFFYNGSKDIRHRNLKDIKLAGCVDPEKLPESLREQVEILEKEMVNNKDAKHFIVANLANGDIIGHKGNPELSVKAAQDIDKAVFDLVNHAIANDYAVLISADHGNIENGLSTKHTENPVPCFVILPKHEKEIKNGLVKIDGRAEAALRDIAPTILDIAGLPNGNSMTGKSLLIEG